ncbi:hypothetical protein [Chitinophaga lutea]|nr:hypothetical protein [Chitinophaga lutea]
MRLTLLYIPMALLLAACSKSQSLEERWLEKSQRKEVIVFRNGKPDSSDMYMGEERSFYFQTRPLPPSSSRASESGIYFYSLAGDSLILKTRQEKFYFRMSADGRSFTIGRFFTDPGGLGDLVIFEKQ